MVQKHIIVSMIAPLAIAGILIMAILANQAYSSSRSLTSVKCKITKNGGTLCKTKTTQGPSKTPQVSKIVKTPQVSTTQTPTAVTNNVTRSPSGQPTGGNVAQGTQKSSITGNTAQGASNTGQGSAKKRTELTISVSQNGPAKNAGSGYNFRSWVPIIISGRLTSEGSGVAGAMILFTCDGEPGDCDADETVQNPTAHYTGGAVQYANTDSGGHYSVGARLSDHKYFKGTKIEASYRGSDVDEDHLNLQSSEASTTTTKVK